jgi:hypothetical protein
MRYRGTDADLRGHRLLHGRDHLARIVVFKEQQHLDEILGASVGALFV